MEHRRQKISLLAVWTTKSANPYFIVYYSFTVVPMIGTSGADNWFMTIIGSLRYVKMSLKVVIFGWHSVTVKFIHRISFETTNIHYPGFQEEWEWVYAFNLGCAQPECPAKKCSVQDYLPPNKQASQMPHQDEMTARVHMLVRPSP